MKLQGSKIASLKFPLRGNDTCFKFIWNFKPDKMKRHTIIGLVDKGGLNMVDFTTVDFTTVQHGLKQRGPLK